MRRLFLWCICVCAGFLWISGPLFAQTNIFIRPNKSSSSKDEKSTGSGIYIVPDFLVNKRTAPLESKRSQRAYRRSMEKKLSVVQDKNADIYRAALKADPDLLRTGGGGRLPQNNEELLMAVAANDMQNLTAMLERRRVKQEGMEAYYDRERRLAAKAEMRNSYLSNTDSSDTERGEKGKSFNRDFNPYR